MKGAEMAGGTVLLADDDSGIRTVLTHALRGEGYAVEATGSAQTLMHWVGEGRGDVVLTDVLMPDGNGLDLIQQIRRFRPELKVIVMSARNTVMTALRAGEAGAFEYLPKPFDLNRLVSVIGSALVSRPSVPSAPLPESDEALPLIGSSAPMQELYRAMARVINTDLTVLITGESGTGKELVARALHDFGPRRAAPLVAVNMAALPRELIESELFGHEKGAFTGATNRTSGRFEQAKGGTLFLDEIGDMPIEAQTRLLRVLQNGEFTPVGGRETQKANVRVIAATHRNLRELVEQGRFREDLFYRLNVVPIDVPPLRQRREDIPELCRHFLQRAREIGLPRRRLEDAALALLMRQEWPGNVRELENVVQRLCALAPHETITAADATVALSAGDPSAAKPGGGLSEAVAQHLHEYFAAHGQRLPTSGLYDRVLREVERPLIALSLAATKGNQIKAASLLGLNRNTLRKKIQELGIDVSRK
jgi:two-component system nitrogen regulation response regulator GlnG